MRDKQKLLQELEDTKKELYNLCHDKQWKLYVNEINRLGRRIDNIRINLNQLNQLKWKETRNLCLNTYGLLY